MIIMLKFFFVDRYSLTITMSFAEIFIFQFDHYLSEVQQKIIKESFLHVLTLSKQNEQNRATVIRRGSI